MYLLKQISTTAFGRLSPLPEADIGGVFRSAELTLIPGDMVRKQLAIVRMWNAENVHFNARWRELFGVIQDGQTRTWNDQTQARYITWLVLQRG